MPGTGGLTPELVLRYNTQTRGTEYGYGWSLNLGWIERSTRKRAPAYSAPLDTDPLWRDDFDLDGDLLVRDGTTAEFRLRYGDGSRITYMALGNYWLVEKPDGTRVLYGSTPGSLLARDVPAGYPSSQPYAFNIYRWLLSEVIDPQGNAYRIYYEPDLDTTPDGTITYTTYAYPKRIEYSFHHGNPVGPRRMVEFEWGPRGYGSELGPNDPGCDGNEDCPTSYRAGFKVQQRRRLVGVVVGVDSDQSGSLGKNTAEQVRRYEMTYSPKTSAAVPEDPPFSQLVAVQRYGRGPGEAAFPTATEFAYTRAPRTFDPQGGEQPIPYLDPAESFEYAYSDSSILFSHFRTIAALDMNGDGILDRLRGSTASSSGGWEIAYGTPTGLETGPQGTAYQPWGWSCPECPENTQDYLEWGVGIREADLVDMDGDGLPDRVTSSQDPFTRQQELTVFRNTGTGFGPPEQWGIDEFPYPPYSITGPFEGTVIPAQLYPITEKILADLNGDGLPDYLPLEILAYLNVGNDFGETILVNGLDLLPGPDGGGVLAHTWYHIVDINGDGLPDSVPTSFCFDGTGWVRFNLGLAPTYEEGYDHAVTFQASGSGHASHAQTCSGVDAWPWGNSLQAIWNGEETLSDLIDMNGDGVPDRVVSRLDGSGFEVYFGLGDGRFLTTGPGGPALGISGVYLPAGVTWAIAVTPQGNIDGTVLVHEGEYNVRTIDVNGDGLPDYVNMRVECSPHLCTGYTEVYLHPGPSGLLEEVENEVGGVTRLAYAASTHLRYQNADPGFEAFTSDWEGETLPPEIRPDPQARWVVTRVEVSDGRPGTPGGDPLAFDEAQDLDYAGLRWDYVRREKFGVRTAQSLDAAGVASRTAFHQDPGMRGKPQFAEVCDGAACYRSEATEWTVFNPLPGAFLPRPTLTTTVLCDESAGLCDVQTTPKQKRIVERQFDPVTGNLLRETDYGPDAELLAAADNRVRTLAYADDPYDHWMLSYPILESTYFGTEDEANLVSQVRLHYDTATFTPGADTGALRCVAAIQTECGGRVRFRETLRQRIPGSEDIWAVESWTYDGYGNVTAYFDPRAFDEGGAATQSVVYDSATQTFPESVTNALGYLSEFRFDKELGRVTRARAPNGYLQCWDYDDDFGRLEGRSEASTAVAPGALESAACIVPLASFAYNDGDLGDPSQQRILETLEVDGIGKTVHRLRFFDGLGREYQTENEYRQGEFDVVTRSWGERGEAVCESLPYRRQGGLGGWSSGFCDDSDPATGHSHRITSYDALLRPAQVDLMGHDGSQFVQVTEITHTYAINSFGGGPDPGLGDLLVDQRTIRTDAGWDRVQYVGLDNRGNVVFLREGTNSDRTTLVVRDPKGRVTRVNGPDVALASGSDDPNLIELAYNAVDQRISLSQPAAPGGQEAAWSYAYDLNGDPSLQISPRGVGVMMHYDALRRPLLRDYAPFNTPGSPGAGDEVFEYHESGDGLGQLASAYRVNGFLVTDFDYDLQGRLTTRTRDFGGTQQFAFSYWYDLMGRPSYVFLPDSTALRYTYDAAALTTIESILPGFGQDVLVSGIEHNASGALKDVTVESPLLGGEPVQTTYGYRPTDARLKTAVTIADPGGAETPIQNLAYGYDTAGNLLTVTDVLGQLNQTFTYDTHHRLETADSTGTQGYGFLSYAYDDAGNLLEKGPGTSASPGIGRLRLHYDRPAAGGPPSVLTVDYCSVASCSEAQWYQNFGAFDYDADGGMISRRVLFTTHQQPNGRDAAGRITYTQLGPNHGATYHYDHTGARFERFDMSSGNILTYRMYVDATFEADWVSNTHEVHVFVGSRRVATSKRPGLGTSTATGTDDVQFYHSDHVGSNTVVTDGATGQIRQETFLKPFGEVHAMLDAAGQPVGNPDDSTTPYLFTDQERDPETDLHYFGARYYDPWVGRFMSQDPELIGAAGGQAFSGLGSEPQLLNPYSYALNRPTILVDPSGRLPWWAGSGGGAPVVTGKTDSNGRPLDLDAESEPPRIHCGTGWVGDVGSKATGSDSDTDEPSQGAQEPGPETDYIGSNWARGYEEAAFSTPDPGSGATAYNRIEGWSYGSMETMAPWEVAGLARLGVNVLRGGLRYAATRLSQWRLDRGVTKLIRLRKAPGADGGISRHVIERNADGTTRSVTHQVTVDGKLIHQHQSHVGQFSGSRTSFPNEWIEYSDIP